MSKTKEALMKQQMDDDANFAELMLDEEYLAWLAKKDKEDIEHMEKTHKITKILAPENVLRPYWSEKGKMLKKGICDDVMYQLLCWLLSFVVLTEEDGWVLPQKPSYHREWEVFFTPKGWFCEINHYVLLLKCTDGKMILDIPMREYTYRKDNKYYFSGNKTPMIWCLTSRNDVMEAYECSKEEANKITDMVKNDDGAYIVNYSRQDLIDCLNAKMDLEVHLV